MSDEDLALLTGGVEALHGRLDDLTKQLPPATTLTQLERAAETVNALRELLNGNLVALGQVQKKLAEAPAPRPPAPITNPRRRGRAIALSGVSLLVGALLATCATAYAVSQGIIPTAMLEKAGLMSPWRGYAVSIALLNETQLQACANQRRANCEVRLR
jgi:hypothetical protein